MCDNNKVFFLGAGFSIAVANNCVTNEKKYPSLEELTGRIFNQFSKTSLYTHLNEISPKYKQNIEFLLTYLSSDMPWKTAQMSYLDKALYFEVVNKISQYFNILEKECCYDFSKFNNFCKYIINNKITTITLNYDTLLEQMLFSQMPEGYQKANDYRGFYKQPIVGLSSRLSDASFGLKSWHNDYKWKELPSIHKLHGSTNWLWSANNPSDTIYCSSKNDDENLKKDLSEYIIPPILDKTNFYNHNILKSIWTDAHRCLQEADEIYIIGFSFPVTDLSVKFLFNSVMQNKKPKIYVINTKEALNPRNNKTYIKDRYNDIFGINNKIDYSYCCENALEKFIDEIIEPKVNSLSN